MKDVRTLSDQGLVLSWLGDDFTGAAAVMEVLTFSGLPSVLFLDLPTSEQLARFKHMRGIGLASTARSQSCNWMDENLPKMLNWLHSLKAPIAHYKVCSTLDSSPEIGSIGRAIDLAKPIFDGWIPAVFAAPSIGRYQAFGHLFATADSDIIRLDRHPVMSRHPVTPMSESDVLIHLGEQTDLKLDKLDLVSLRDNPQKKVDELLTAGAELVAFDVISREDEEKIGKIIWESIGDVSFAIGSQGLEYALVAHWQKTGLLPADTGPRSAGLADQMIAVSGSVSMTTAAQIDWAEQNGFKAIDISAARLIKGDKHAEIEAIERAKQALDAGLDPIVLTARGPDDPEISRFRQATADTQLNSEDANELVGQALGRILASLLEETGIRRAAISGGDTSGHASKQLDLFAFTALAPTIPGAALLKAHSEIKQFDGMELALKGGQMGSPDYFGNIKRGGAV